MVNPYRFSHNNLEDFRDAVKQITATPQGVHLVAAYSRKALQQTGEGHFSPIGGYHPKRDLVLLLDVARFKYPPHWVNLSALWKAFEPVDPTTGQCRGYILLQKSERLHETFFHIALAPQQWRDVAPYLAEVLPAFFKTEQPDTIAEVVREILHNLPPLFMTLLGTSSGRAELPPELRIAIQLNPLFEIIKKTLSQSDWAEKSVVKTWRSQQPFLAELIAVILLSCPETLYATLRPDLQGWLSEVRQLEKLSYPLDREVSRLREQIFALQEFYGSGESI